MDRMPKYIPARDREIRLTRRRGIALLNFVKALADAGDLKAGAFLGAMRDGAFDPPRDGDRDSGIRLVPRPSTVRPSEP
jgi:hypothetical protein